MRRPMNHSIGNGGNSISPIGLRLRAMVPIDSSSFLGTTGTADMQPPFDYILLDRTTARYANDNKRTRQKIASSNELLSLNCINLSNWNAFYKSNHSDLLESRINASNTYLK